MRSGQGRFGFFTPKDDVFDGLTEDPCAFEVGAYIPTFSGSDGSAVILHMYVGIGVTTAKSGSRRHTA